MMRILLMASLCALLMPAFAQNSVNFDSAGFFFENGNVSRSRTFLTKAIVPGSTDQHLFLLASRVENHDGYFQRSIDYGLRAKSLAQAAGDKSTEAAALIEIAFSSIELGKTDSVLLYAQQAEHTDTTGLNRIGVPLVRARYWHSLNQPPKALPFYQKALMLSESNNAVKHRILALTGMASLYFSLEPNMKRVISLLNEAMSLSDSSKHADIIARNSARMANANMVLGNLPRAEAYLMRAKTITDITHNMPVESYVLSSIAILRALQGDLGESIKIAAGPIRMKREMGQVKALQNDLLNLAEWQMELKQYPQASETIREGIATSSALKDYVFLNYYYEHLATLDSLTGKFPDAYTHLKQSMIFKDSTIALQNAKAVNEIREKYETEQREKLLAEKELEIQEQRNRIVLILSMAVIVVLIFVVILIVIRNRHKLRLALEKENQNKLRLQTIINTQEEVQQDIARDIHDGLVQMMGAAKLSLQAIRPGDEMKSLLEKTSRASAIIDDACTEARNISHQLLPYSLMREGFASALRELVRNSFATYSFDGEDNIELDQEVAVNLYRISQEIINNISKHAEATFVKVTVKTSAHHLSIIFEDNGKGFDPMKVRKGAGLVNIMTRAEVIGAGVDISSQPGSGTITNIEVDL